MNIYDFNDDDYDQNVEAERAEKTKKMASFPQLSVCQVYF